MLDGVLCVIFLHGRSSPQTSPSATPCLMKSLSFEAQPEELEEQPLSPMRYARSGLGTAALNGKFVAAGESRRLPRIKRGRRLVRSVAQPSRSATFVPQEVTTERNV